MAEDLLPLLVHDQGGDDDDLNDSDDGDEPMNDEYEGQLDENQDEDDVHIAPNVTYDPALAGAHSYLGTDLEELRGRTVHEDDAYLSLPILSLPGVVLVPGQTLPLHLFQSSTVALIQRVVNGDKTFGIVTSRHGENGSKLCSIGTTAEIFSMKEEKDDRAGITTIRVKAIGRQRFKIKETRRTVDGTFMAKVHILPEKILPDCLEGARPGSHVKVYASPSDPASQSGIDFTEQDHAAVLKQFISTTKTQRKRRERLASGYMTWWPPWVYKMYDVHHVMQRVREELSSWNETLKPEHMPIDPTELSFWVAGNLPLDDTLKLHLLTIDCAVQRLRCELSIMQRCTVLCCKVCGALIANKKDVFSMAIEGPLGAYVNPGGYVYETLTFYKAQNLTLIGHPSVENSWFPGYAWTILQCRNCNHLMGWKFTSRNRKLLPEKFWGLCRSSLLPGLQNEDSRDDLESWRPVM